MASAIRETADSARERQEAEARIRQENDALAHEFARLKSLGLGVELVPLDQVATYKLVRDRDPGDDPELAELIASIRAVGLSNPIRVERAGEGAYELVQGYRRLAAYRALLAETGDAAAYGTIPAAVWDKGADIDALYRRMVDENLVRKGVSFAEMAQLALDYAADPQVEENDPDRAVAELFKSAGYQKRSYIRAFIRVVESLGPVLEFKTEIPRSLGTALSARLDEVEGLAGAIRSELAGWENRSVADELGVLRRFAGQDGDEGAEAVKPATTPKPRKGQGGQAKTTLQFDRAEGRVRCTAQAGRLEVKLDKDFSNVDRRTLESALRLMLDQLG